MSQEDCYAAKNDQLKVDKKAWGKFFNELYPFHPEAHISLWLSYSQVDNARDRFFTPQSPTATDGDLYQKVCKDTTPMSMLANPDTLALT